MAVPSNIAPTTEKLTPAAVDAIASRSFSTSFRGWDPDEVRVHLVQVAELVRGLTQRQLELERRLVEAEAAARRADLTELDINEVSQVLGEETARVLRTARESSAEIRAKAEERVALLSRQAADDAAKTRETAAAEAEQLRTSAHEEAAGTRSAGDAYVSEVRADAESEVAAIRIAVDEELAALRQAARDEAAQVTAAADDAAAKIRSEAEADGERIRTEADTYADGVRLEADGYATQVKEQANAAASALTTEAEAATTRQREEAQHTADEIAAAAEAELAEAKVTATERIAEAERVRERVLADLSRKRKAARQHLEQLRAGRDRLLEAYEVIRATTDNATRELGTVLPDAKRAADDAARRISAEPDQSVADLEVELDVAREANLPIMAKGPTASELVADDDLGTDDGLGTLEDAPVVEDDVIDTRTASESASIVASESAADSATGESAGAAVEVTASDEEVPGAPALAPLGRAPSLPPRKSTHRFLHRHDDPLGGESLPDVPLAPVEVGAEFEEVRVISLDESDEAAVTDEAAVSDEVAVTDVAAGTDELAVIEDVAETDVVAGTGPVDDADDVSESKSIHESGAKPSAAEAALAAVGKSTPEPTVKVASDAESEPTDKSDKSEKSDTVDGSGKPEKKDIDGIFQRLRTERGQATDAPEGAAVAGEEPAPTDDADKNDSTDEPEIDAAEARIATLFERRDAAVEGVAQRLTKRIKRVLSDEQSELLDGLRRAKKRPSSDQLLPSAEDHDARYAEAASKDLPGAVVAGVLFAGDLSDDAAESTDTSIEAVAAELAESITGPMRARLERALRDQATADEGDETDVDTGPVDELELADRIRSCYREWRGTRLSDLVTDACANAFGLGVRDALPAGIGLEWTVDQHDDPCADCGDNVLAGVVAKGEPFPTGQFVPPAHPGCRCMVLPPTS